MDFSLRDEQRFIRDTIEKFLARECGREVVKKLDEERKFPADLYRTVAGMGFCGLTIPEEYGGGGPNVLGAALVTEELATVSPVLAGAFSAAAFRGGLTLSTLGSEAQKKALLPKLAEGAHLFSLAAEEPGLTGGAGPFQTRAERRGEVFVVNGAKSCAGLADHADYLIVPVSTEGIDGDENSVTVFLVRTGSGNIRITPAETVGFVSGSFCDVVFDDLVLTREDILGGDEHIGRGRVQMEGIAACANLEVAAIARGIMKGCYEYALNYAKEREQFGQAIIRFGGVQDMLVEMAVSVRVAGDLLYRACWCADRGDPYLEESTMARLRACRDVRHAAMDCMQVLGGYGYANEYDAQRYLRDSLVMLEGTPGTGMLKDTLAHCLWAY